jgi:hypothetical protein
MLEALVQLPPCYCSSLTLLPLSSRTHVRTIPLCRPPHSAPLQNEEAYSGNLCALSMNVCNEAGQLLQLNMRGE